MSFATTRKLYHREDHTNMIKLCNLTIIEKMTITAHRNASILKLFFFTLELNEPYILDDLRLCFN